MAKEQPTTMVPIWSRVICSDKQKICMKIYIQVYIYSPFRILDIYSVRLSGLFCGLYRRTKRRIIRSVPSGTKKEIVNKQKSFYRSVKGSWNPIRLAVHLRLGFSSHLQFINERFLWQETFVFLLVDRLLNSSHSGQMAAICRHFQAHFLEWKC